MIGLPAGGMIASLPTPFTRDGSVDLPALRRLVRFSADSEAAAVLVNGLAGEVADLTERERAALVEACLEASEERLPSSSAPGPHRSARRAASRARPSVREPPE